MADQTPVTPELPPPSRPDGSNPDSQSTVPADGEAPPPVMPRWVPILIGLVLVLIAAFAVYTGMRYRENTLTSIIRNDDASPGRTMRPGPPGEQEAGGSLMSGKTPDANAAVTGSSRAVVTGGPQGVEVSVRMWARRGMIFDVTPKDAAIYVNDEAIGQASQFDSDEEVYDFAQPGSYNVRIVSPGRPERHYTVTAAADAPNEVVTIRTDLGAGPQ
jgi:hypothetical protein